MPTISFHPDSFEHLDYLFKKSNWGFMAHKPCEAAGAACETEVIYCENVQIKFVSLCRNIPNCMINKDAYLYGMFFGKILEKFENCATRL